MLRKIASAAALVGIAIAAPAAAQVEVDAEPGLEFVFEETVTLSPGISPGQTPWGGRNIVPITGGTFEGPGIKGEVMPGGWDWQLIRPDGCLDVLADYFLKTDDGVIINVRNTGVACRPEEGEPLRIRTHPVFEAPVGKYDWLNRTMFVGTLIPDNTEEREAVRIRFYKIN